MATGIIPLPVLGAITFDGSASNAAPQLQRTKSSASAPSPHFFEALYDPAADEHLAWVVPCPPNYSSSPVCKIHWKANATSGSVVWVCRVAAITPGDTDTPNEKAYAAANSATTAVNATEARREVETSITLTNADSMSAGDTLLIVIHRDADNGSDDCAVDAELFDAWLEYTTT